MACPKLAWHPSRKFFIETMASSALLRRARSKADSSPRSSGLLFPIPCVLGFPKVQFPVLSDFFSQKLAFLKLVQTGRNGTDLLLTFGPHREQPKSSLEDERHIRFFHELLVNCSRLQTKTIVVSRVLLWSSDFGNFGASSVTASRLFSARMDSLSNKGGDGKGIWCFLQE